MSKKRLKKESVSQTRQRIDDVAARFVKSKFGDSLQLTSSEQSPSDEKVWDVIFDYPKNSNFSGINVLVSVDVETEEVTIYSSM